MWELLVVGGGTLGLMLYVGFAAALLLRSPVRSVLEHGLGTSSIISKDELWAIIKHPGVGMQLAWVGIVLSILGARLIRREISLPPLRPFGALQGSSSPGLSDRTKIFIWYTITLSGFVGMWLAFALDFPLVWISNHAGWGSFGNWVFTAGNLPRALILLGVGLWSLGCGRIERFRRVLKFPGLAIFATGIALPIAAHWLPHVIAYAVNRVTWAQHWSTNSEVPSAYLYLHVPPFTAVAIGYAALAVLSEFAWRGCAQRPFLERFGVQPGLVFIGLLYGLNSTLLLPHLPGGLLGFVIRLVFGLAWGIAISVTVGWLTLQSGSVWPAVVCMATNSILTQAAMRDVEEAIGRSYLRLTQLLVWIAAAFLVVYLFPVREATGSAPSNEPAANLEMPEAGGAV